MNLWRLRTEKQWGVGFFAVLLLALVFGAIALAQLEKIDSSAQHLATQLLPRAVQASDLRVQLNRLRRLEAGLLGARTLAEVQLYAEQFSAQQQRVRAVEAGYEKLLDNGADRILFAAYSASRSDYLKLQQRLLELALAVDFSSADSTALSSKELLTTYAGASQNSFATATAALEQWQQDNATAAQLVSAQTRGVATHARAWILGALGGGSLLAVLLLLLTSTRAGTGAQAAPASVPRAGGSAFPAGHGPAFLTDSRYGASSGVNQAREIQGVGPDVGLGTDAPRKGPWALASAPPSKTRPTRVTAEDWESF